jgi:hypothetical protein
MQTISTSDRPQKAPANFRTLPAEQILSDGDGLFQTWQGSGIPTGEACNACGNTEGNLKIYGNWGYSYPNGNSWDDSEIVCGKCGRFTLILNFQEG